MGKGTLETTHANLVASMKHCANVSFEQLTTDYDAGAAQWLRAWDISDTVAPVLIKRMSRHDVHRLSPEMKARDAHITSLKWNSANKRALDAAIWGHAELAALIRKQRAELGYYTP